jgi:hypothetical protein
MGEPVGLPGDFRGEAGGEDRRAVRSVHATQCIPPFPAGAATWQLCGALRRFPVLFECKLSASLPRLDAGRDPRDDARVSAEPSRAFVRCCRPRPALLRLCARPLQQLLGRLCLGWAAAHAFFPTRRDGSERAPAHLSLLPARCDAMRNAAVGWAFGLRRQSRASHRCVASLGQSVGSPDQLPLGLLTPLCMKASAEHSAGRVFPSRIVAGGKFWVLSRPPLSALTSVGVL